MQPHGTQRVETLHEASLPRSLCELRHAKLHGRQRFLATNCSSSTIHDPPHLHDSNLIRVQGLERHDNLHGISKRSLNETTQRVIRVGGDFLCKISQDTRQGLSVVKQIHRRQTHEQTGSDAYKHVENFDIFGKIS